MKTKFYFPSFLFAFALFFTTVSSAQTLGVRAFKETTPYIQEFHKIAKTSDGGIIGVGPNGYWGRVTKMNASLVQQWSLGIDSIALLDVVETNDGNYVLMGLAITTNYYNAVYIIKVNPSGTLLFEKMFSSGPMNQFTADGICKAAGSDSGFVFFGGNCSAMHYLIKCDKNGNVVWERQHVGYGNGTYVAMIAENNGYVGELNYLGAHSDVGIAKMDVNGNLLWDKIYDAPVSVGVLHNSLTEKANGDYLICTQPNDSSGVQDYLIDNSGNTVTCKRHIITGSIAWEPTNVFATGNANDELLLLGLLSPGLGTYMKLSATDAIVYDKQYTLSTSYFNNAVSMGAGVYALGGSTGSNGKIVALIDENGGGVCNTTNLNFATSSVNLTTTTVAITNVTVNELIAVGNFSLYPVSQTQTNLCGTLDVNSVADNNSGIDIYPNPTNEKITVTANNETIRGIKIMNAVGQVCFHAEEINAEETTIDMKDLESGIYFLQIDNGKGTTVKKIIKR